MPTWKFGGYVLTIYENDHRPLHVHVSKDGRLLDRYDYEHGQFMDETIGKHRGRALKALRAAGLI